MKQNLKLLAARTGWSLTDEMIEAHPLGWMVDDLLTELAYVEQDLRVQLAQMRQDIDKVLSNLDAKPGEMVVAVNSRGEFQSYNPDAQIVKREYLTHQLRLVAGKIAGTTVVKIDFLDDEAKVTDTVDGKIVRAECENSDDPAFRCAEADRVIRFATPNGTIFQMCTNCIDEDEYCRVA